MVLFLVWVVLDGLRYRRYRRRWMRPGLGVPPVIYYPVFWGRPRRPRPPRPPRRPPRGPGGPGLPMGGPRCVWLCGGNMTGIYVAFMLYYFRVKIF